MSYNGYVGNSYPTDIPAPLSKDEVQTIMCSQNEGALTEDQAYELLSNPNEARKWLDSAPASYKDATESQD